MLMEGTAFPGNSIDFWSGLIQVMHNEWKMNGNRDIQIKRAQKQ